MRRTSASAFVATQSVVPTRFCRYDAPIFSVPIGYPPNTFYGALRNALTAIEIPTANAVTVRTMGNKPSSMDVDGLPYAVHSNAQIKRALMIQAKAGQRRGADVL